MTDARTNGRVTDQPYPEEPTAGSFGPNAWLVEDMYDRFLIEPSSVGDSWREFFTGYRPGPLPTARVVVDSPPATGSSDGPSALRAPAANGAGNGTARAAIDASSAPVAATAGAGQ